MQSAFAPPLTLLSLPRASARPPPTARPASASLTGSDRRFLRSEAGRRDAAKTLAHVRLPYAPSLPPPLSARSALHPGETPERAPGVSDLSGPPPPLPDGVVAEIGARLAREEIVRVKTGAKKKRVAKTVGDALVAAVVGAEVVQVIGHTVLLYRPGVEGEMVEGRAKLVLPSGG